MNNKELKEKIGAVCDELWDKEITVNEATNRIYEISNMRETQALAERVSALENTVKGIVPGTGCH